MSRQKRIKGKFKHAGYHVVSRTIHREFLFDDHMKAFFKGLISRLSWLYETRIYGWSILSNHTHICLSFRSPDEVNADRAIKRWNRYHKNKHLKNGSVPEDRVYVVDCLTDISHFMKKLNTLMTREYNRSTGHTGTLWERRFRSTVVQHGRPMLLTAAYIELNSFRASMAAKPENYRYCSLYHLKKGNPRDIVDAESIGRWLHMGSYPDNTERMRKGSNKKSTAEKKYLKELYESYLKYIYEQGSRAPKRKLIKGKTDSIKVTEQMQKQLDQKMGTDAWEAGKDTGMQLQKGVGLCRRIWTFSRGKFIGHKGFAKRGYGDYMDPGYEKMSRIKRHRKKWVHGMPGGVWGVFNGSRRSREEKEWKETEGREQQQGQGNINGKNGMGKSNPDGQGKWVGGGQRGSPPV